MRQSRFTDEQILGMVREVVAGAKVAEVCRRHGVSKETLRRWRAKYRELPPRRARVWRAPRRTVRPLRCAASSPAASVPIREQLAGRGDRTSRGTPPSGLPRQST